MTVHGAILLGPVLFCLPQGGMRDPLPSCSSPQHSAIARPDNYRQTTIQASRGLFLFRRSLNVSPEPVAGQTERSECCSPPPGVVPGCHRKIVAGDPSGPAAPAQPLAVLLATLLLRLRNPEAIHDGPRASGHGNATIRFLVSGRSYSHYRVRPARSGGGRFTTSTQGRRS